MSLREIIPTGFSSLLNLFGISLQSGRDNTFVLRGEVAPVVLVGSTTAIQAIANDATLDVPFSAGPLAAPALNTILADTGAQAEGIYACRIMVGGRPTSGNQGGVAIERRDAANATNIWIQELGVDIGTSYFEQISCVVQLRANERIRARVSVGATITLDCNIWLQRIG